MKTRLQFLAALLVAGIFAILLWDKPWTRLKGMGRVFRSKEKAPPAVVKERNDRCHACPVFYRKLGTCGSPLDPQLEGLGCWCHCKTKNQFKLAGCWLRTQTNGEHGWPQDL